MGIQFSAIRLQTLVVAIGFIGITACRESREIFAESAPPKKRITAPPKPQYKKTFKPRPGFEPFDGIDHVPANYTFMYEPIFITQKPVIKRSFVKLSSVVPSGGGKSASTLDLQEGNEVEHGRFGKGKIISIEGNDSNKKAMIDFEKHGKKQLLLKFAQLKVINYFFKKDENLSSGINNISILSSNINTKYNIKDHVVIFQSDGSRVYNSKIDYNGQLAINPFDLNLKINLYDYKISNLFTPNSIINEFIKSGLLFNENISVHTLVNIKSTKKDEIFNEAKLELRVLNGKISFDKSIFINNNIGLIEVSNSDLFLENDRLILTSNLSIDIKDIDGLFSFLNTDKKSRKDIKNIKLNIIYDFLSNQIELKNIKINDNDVSSQFNNIAGGFIDINSNNLTKSRKLLNELINLYDG